MEFYFTLTTWSEYITMFIVGIIILITIIRHFYDAFLKNRRKIKYLKKCGYKRIIGTPFYYEYIKGCNQISDEDISNMSLKVDKKKFK